MSTRYALCFAILYLAAQASAQGAFRFGLANSAAKRAAQVADDSLPATPSMCLPILQLESITTGQVIWPFGVQGGGHPMGHPGIDFQTVLNGSVFASATAKVSRIEDSYTDGTPQKYIQLETPGYQLAYVGTLINITVVPGSFVSKGQKIAELGPFSGWGNRNGFLHWGMYARSNQMAICPYDFLDPTAQGQLSALFAFTTYAEQSQFPLLCNPCPAGGCR